MTLGQKGLMTSADVVHRRGSSPNGGERGNVWPVSCAKRVFWKSCKLINVVVVRIGVQ